MRIAVDVREASGDHIAVRGAFQPGDRVAVRGAAALDDGELAEGGIYDVHSSSPDTAMDGTYYRDW